MKGLKAAQAKLQEMQDKGIKKQYLSPVEKAYKNPKSLRLALNGNCWICAGNGADGSKMTKDTIRLCTDGQCPLHPLRPYQPKTEIVPLVR